MQSFRDFLNYKSNLLFAFLTLNSSLLTLSAQSHAIDSLQRLLHTAKEDTNKVYLLVNLCHEFDNTNNLSRADSFAHAAVNLSTKLGYNYGIVSGLTAVGSIYDDEGNFGEALKAYQKGLDLSKETHDKRDEARILGNMAVNYYSQGNYPKSLDYNFLTLKMAIELGDKRTQANTLGNIAIVYDEEGEYDKSIDYTQQSIDMYNKMGDLRGVARNTGNLGSVYADKHDTVKALACFNRALEMNEKLGRKMGIINNLIDMGSISLDRHKYPDALYYYIRALKAAQDYGDKSNIAVSTGSIGEVYLGQKKYKEAEDYITRAMAMASEIGRPELMKVYYRDFSKIYSAEGEWQKSAEAFKRYVAIKDSLNNDDKSKQIGKLEARADYDKQLALQKSEEDKKALLASADSKRQKMLTVFVGAIALAVAIIAILIFRSLRITRKQKTLIERQKQEVEKQKSLVEEQKKDILDSIAYAKRLQDAILPPMSLIKEHVPESFVLYKPKDIVAGDFYWMETVLAPLTPPDRGIPGNIIEPSLGGQGGRILFIAAADCTGHGVPGALVSVVCSNALNRTVKEFKITEPGKILDKVRELVIETFEKSDSNVQDGMDISLCSISPLSRGEGLGVRLQWSGANNPLWYVSGAGEMKEVTANKEPIGKYYTSNPFTTHTIKLQKGDTVYLFTDGYADQFGGPSGKKFKFRKLQEKLLAISQKPLAEQKEILDKTFEEWRGTLEQTDDVCVIGIRI